MGDFEGLLRNNSRNHHQFFTALSQNEDLGGIFISSKFHPISIKITHPREPLNNQNLKKMHFGAFSLRNLKTAHNVCEIKILEIDYTLSNSRTKFEIRINY